MMTAIWFGSDGDLVLCCNIPIMVCGDCVCEIRCRDLEVGGNIDLGYKKA
jgi:hypothetical protein